MNGIVKNISALSISTTGQFTSLTKGQKALLKLIRDKIERKNHLSFDDVILVYYHNIRKNYTKAYYQGTNEQGRPVYRYEKLDILEAWVEQRDKWHYRTSIRVWFIQNIGSLVVKNQLVIIPTIDLGPEEEPQDGK